MGIVGFFVLHCAHDMANKLARGSWLMLHRMDYIQPDQCHQKQLSECIDLELRARQISLGRVEQERMDVPFLGCAPACPCSAAR